MPDTKSLDQKQQQLQKQLLDAMSDEALPTMYFNGFINSLGAGDVLLLTRSGRPIALLNMSYTVAKTLAQKLGRLIADLESQSGNIIMTTDDVNAIMGRVVGEENHADE